MVTAVLLLALLVLVWLISNALEARTLQACANRCADLEKLVDKLRQQKEREEQRVAALTHDLEQWRTMVERARSVLSICDDLDEEATE